MPEVDGRKPYLVRVVVTTVREVVVHSHAGEAEKDAGELQACNAFNIFPALEDVEIAVLREATPEDEERTRPTRRE